MTRLKVPQKPKKVETASTLDNVAAHIGYIINLIGYILLILLISTACVGFLVGMYWLSGFMVLWAVDIIQTAFHAGWTVPHTFWVNVAVGFLTAVIFGAKTINKK